MKIDSQKIDLLQAQQGLTSTALAEKSGKKKIVFPKKAFLDYLKEVCGLEST